MNAAERIKRNKFSKENVVEENTKNYFTESYINQLNNDIGGLGTWKSQEELTELRKKLSTVMVDLYRSNDASEPTKKLYSSVKSARDYLDSISSEYAKYSSAEDYNKQLEQYKEQQKRYEELASSTDATTGWEKYLADVEISKQTAKQEEEKKPWWETILGYLSAGSTADTTLPTAPMTTVIEAIREDDSYARPQDTWSEDQKRVFGALYLTNPDEAYQYAVDTNNRNNKTAEEDQIKKIQESVTSSFGAGFANTLGAIATAPLGMADYLQDIAYANAGRPITSDGIVSPFEYSQAVTSGISSNLNEEFGTIDEDVFIFGGKGVGDIYGLGTSIAQSMLSAYTLGGTGTLVSYFGQGAAAGADEALARGASDEQAILYGTALGVFEGLAEEIGVDNLFKLGSSSTVKGFIKNILKQAGAEGAEEGLTSLLSNIADNVIMQDKSNFNALVEKYMAQGMSESDAKTKAWMDSVGGIAFDTIAGSVSGGVSGGIHTAISNVAYNQQIKSHGQSIIDQGGTDTLRQLALEMARANQNSQGQKIANLAGKVASKSSAKNIGKLSAYMQDTITEQNKADVQKALEKSGLSKKEANRVAEYLASTSELTKKQKAEIEGNENIKAVVEELLDNPKSAISERTRNLLYARLGVDATKSSNVSSRATESGKMAVKVETDVKDKVSENGKTTRISSGEEITINKNNAIAKIKNVDGERVVYLNTDHGVVASSDITYANESDALIYESFVDMNPAFANAVIKNYDGSIPIQTYINGMREGIIVYGMHNFQAVGKDISKNSFLAELSEADQNFALKLGRAYAKTDAKKAEAPLRKAIKNAEKKAASEEATFTNTKAKKGKVYFENGAKAMMKHKKTVTLAKHLANAIGINIAFYDATIKGTKHSDSNGYYDSETNTIHLDLQNATSDAKTIAFTLSHELVHFIKDKSPSQFNTFAKFLMEQYAEHGVDTSTLLSNKMAELGTTDADYAYEEMIADACETMLLDSNAVYKLMELRKSDLNLFETIKLHIYELLSKIREEYKKLGLQPSSDEAKALLKMEDVLEQIYSKFEDALVEATQNYQAEQTLNTESVSVSEDGTVRLQMKQYQQTGRATLLRYLKEQYGDANANDLILTIDNIYDAMKEIKSDEALSVFGNWQDTEVELDENGHPIFTTSVKNGDYELNQDFSRVCKKRRQLDFVLNMLAEDPAFEASHLTKQDFVKINKAIKAHGFEIACALCFVDSKRFRQAEWADSFANTWNDILNAVVKDSSKLTPFNFATKNPNLSDDGIEIDTSKAVTYRKWSDGKEDVKNRRTYENFDQMLSKGDDGKWLEGNTNVRTIATLIRDNPELRHTFRGADIIASKGFDTIQRLAPGIRGILDGWGGSSVPKPSSNDASYDSSIINMSGYNKETAYAMGGVRMNSFSDFMAHMFFDYCQAFADLSAKALPSQAYTKELIYVRLFGRSGQKINMSGIAAIRDDALPTTAQKGVTKSEAEANEKIEKMVAGLDVTRLLEHLNKDIYQITEADVEQFLDMCDYVWADESINMKHATLLQTGILYDKLSESKIEECYELLKAGEIEQALKVAGKDNVDTEYAKNCGTIVVGVSDAHIRKLLRDPTVRMVIPYHKSGLNPVIARELRISAYNDYTLSQSTGVKRKGSKASEKIGSTAIKDAYGLKDFEFYDWFGKTVDGKLYDGKATADKYLEWCEKGYYDESVGDYVYYTTKGNGYILAKDFHKKASIVPKFDAFVGEENYYKVLEDFDCYNTISGEHSAQGAVDFLRNGLPTDYKDVLVGALKEEQKVHDDFKDALDNKGLKDEVMDIVKARGYEPSIKKQAKKKSSYESIEDDVKKFATEIDQWVRDGKQDNTTFILGSTGDVLQGLGAIESDIYILGDKIKTILSDHPEISIADVKKIPQIVGDPVLILKSRNVGRKSKANSRLVIFGTVKASNGNHILSVLDLKPIEKGLVIDDMQKVNSVYTKTEPASFVSNSDVVYADKKRTTSLLRAIGFQMPIALQQSGYIGSISYSRDIVNIHGKTFSEVVATNDVKKQLKKSSSYAPTFYSQMGKVIDDIKMDKIGATSIVNYLKGKGIKNDEIKWSGIETWLEGKKSVTKAELQEFVAGSQLVIEEEMSGKDVDLRYDGSKRAYILYDSNGNVIDTFTYNKFMDGYIAESDEEIYYNENELRDAVRDVYGYASAPKWADYKLDGGTNYRELVFKMPNSSYSNRAMRTHWGQDAEGILVHARIQDFVVNGKKMLFIEELQSDWHNEGMEKGYTTPEYEDAVTTANRLSFEYDEIGRAWSKYIASNEFNTDSIEVRKQKYEKHRLEEDAAMWRKIDAEKQVEVLKKKGMGDVADAPFRDTYHEYVLKRLLRMAAEEGYDSIGWTPADIQSKRWSYDYEKAYKIEYDQEMPKFLRKYGKKWGATVGTTYVNPVANKDTRIAEYERDIADNKRQINEILDVVGEIGIDTIADEQIQFLTEGIKELQEGMEELNGTKIWSMDITEAMEQSVLYEGQAKFQKKKLSNRTILANALESSIDTSTQAGQNELRWLKDYQAKIALIENEEAHLAEVNAEIKEISFNKGTDRSKLKDLNADKNRTANRITTYDKQLMRLEAMKPIKDVLAREKEMVRKRTEEKGREKLQAVRERDAKTLREVMNRNQESRKKAMDSRHRTEMRHKIHKIVSELNQTLLNPTKEKHVPIGLQKPVAEALAVINMDTVGAEERIAKYDALIAKAKDPDKIEALKKSRDNIELQGESLKDRLEALKNAYAAFVKSDDPLIRNAHNAAIENLIENTADKVGNTPLRNMSYEQLEAVYDMFKAIRATVRNANKMFKEGRQETVSENSSNVTEEIRQVGGHRNRELKALKAFNKYGWNMFKPITAMKVIGSNTFEKLFNNVRAGEDTWAVDVSEAKEFFRDKAKQYDYWSWDFKKQYSFKDGTNRDFSLSLEQIMSLYAYSKRSQADKHLEIGGFVFDDAIEVTESKHGIPLKYTVNDANPYRLNKNSLGEVISALTDEQKQFLDEMQAYLSDVMGAKGNEVSLAMYDIKLYNEKNYFPLKTSKHFREFNAEQSAMPNLKNSGFSKKTVPQAGNPIVLSNFMDVWSSHVNDMSMYHAFVLPLEDFMRVYNYSSTVGGYDSVQQYIKNAYGSQANTYIETLLKDLNGGARVDNSADLVNKGIALFKKASVFASASVVIQQPSAMARAMAYINPKYFATNPHIIDHKAEWAELKKYAPIAIIKEMGYFDTNVGKKTTDWITEREYEGIAQKSKAVFTDSGYRDEILSKAPAMADELSWAYIWEAVKKETKATTKLEGEELLKQAGKRFTEVIANTQVYDSVLSRSAMMRSKDTGMKMATAFMAEPTTVVNMMVDGIIQSKRGNKKFLKSTIGAVSASIILNSILVSLVYAARDDDEDETYPEKYLESLTAEFIDGFNPITYLPFAKDIWSIAQGYDVERSDMSIWSKLVESIESLFSEKKSGWEKTEEVIGAISSLFGLPFKNILRDARGIYNLASTLTSGTETTSKGISEAVEDAAKSSIPFWNRIEKYVGADESKSDKLYEAIMSGDQAHINRVKSQYADEKAINSAIRTALRENDPRIHDAAQARYNGDIATYKRIAKEIIAEGRFSQDDVVAAINSEMTVIKRIEATEQNIPEDTTEEVTSIYKASDVIAAFDNGDKALALEILNELIDTKVANGMTEKEAKSSLRSSMTSYWKPLYKQAWKNGDTNEMKRIRYILFNSGLYGNGNEVVSTVNSWLKD